MNKILIITGPTGVGKTDLVDTIATAIPSTIINADVGQMCLPLSIGTAKPDWKNSSIPHYLFDVIDTPRPLTVSEYRSMVLDVIALSHTQNRLPIIVGGSLFYIRSLLFPPYQITVASDIQPSSDIDYSWEFLNSIDPTRAQAIHPHDTYRIQRAIDIWITTGTMPSLYKPRYQPPYPYACIYLDRDRAELYDRIDRRVYEMLKSGWIEEVKSIMGTEWETFAIERGIIGYPEIITYLTSKESPYDYGQMVESIQKQTRNYAKRQQTFWRSLQRDIITQHDPHAYIDQVNLTFVNAELYINQLLRTITNI